MLFDIDINLFLKRHKIFNQHAFYCSNSPSQLKKTEGQGSPRGQGHLRSEGISEIKTEERKGERIRKVNISTKLLFGHKNKIVNSVTQFISVESLKFIGASFRGLLIFYRLVGT